MPEVAHRRNVDPNPPCPLCEEPILLTDQARPMNGRPRGAHRECLIRSALGGIEHLTAPPMHRIGSCYEGSTLSYRESARQAAAWVAEHGVDSAVARTWGDVDVDVARSES